MLNAVNLITCPDFVYNIGGTPFDRWLFSKLDESLDEVYIPYYNPKTNGIARFKPDFIFWLQKGNEYYIVFVDPKGISHTDYQYKIDGYKDIFENTDETIRKFSYGKVTTCIFAFLYTSDEHKIPKGYKKYWFDNIEKMLSIIANSKGK